MLSKQLPLKSARKYSSRLLLVLGFSLGAASSGFAQLSNFHSEYFQDPYLVNPAMAGIDGGLKINSGYQMLNTNTAGSPNAKFGTIEIATGDRAALGLVISSDQAGLIARTRIMGSYAYHIPLSETDKLSLGLSLGMNSTHFQSDQVVGDQGDQSAALYNARPTYIDGDFGVAYTGEQLTVQGAIPNLRSLFFKSADQSLAPYRSNLFVALSYKIPIASNDNTTTVSPMLAFRGFKDIDGVFDVGANLSMLSNHINLSGMYHTNQSMTIAAGMGVRQVGFMFSYTNDMGPFRTYAANTFELGLKFNLLEKGEDKGPNAY